MLAVINDQNQSIEVRRRALEAIASVSLPQVKTAIMEAYQSQDSSFKASAIYAMGKNCDLSWLPTLLKELVNTDVEVRYEAAGACGELEDEEAVPYLIKMANDSDIDVQMAAIQALSKIGSAQAKEHLEACLNNVSETICQAAEQALNELEVKQDPLPFRF